MKEFLKIIGMIITIIGIGILGYVSFKGINNNTLLGVCGLLIVIGLVFYIIINKKIE